MKNDLNIYLRGWRISGQDFARLAGIQTTTLSRIRNGRQRPTLAQAVAIEDATGGVIPARSWVEDGGHDESRGATALILEQAA